MSASKTDKMERFAFDIFVDTMSRFKTTTAIPTPKCRENTYNPPDLLRVLSRGYIAYQLQKRDTWKVKFETKFKSNGLKKFKQISEILDETLKEMDDEPDKNALLRVITSLALINELIQFLHSKNSRLFLNDLASFWRNHFAHFEEEFETLGGLSFLYSLHIEESFLSLQAIIDNFICNYCIPYGKMEISKIFHGMSLFSPFLQMLKKAVIDKQEFDLLELESRFGEKLSITIKFSETSDQKAEVSDSLKNTGHEIRPHEELLRDSCSLSHYEGISLEKFDNASFTEGASAAVDADVKMDRNHPGQSNGEHEKRCRELSTQIVNPVERGGLTGSPVNPEEQTKHGGGLTGSPVNPEEQTKHGGGLTESPVNPEEQTKHGGGLTRSSLIPEQ